MKLIHSEMLDRGIHDDDLVVSTTCHLDTVKDILEQGVVELME